MSAPLSNDASDPAPSTGTDVPTLAPKPSPAIATRHQLPRTRLGEGRGILRGETEQATPGPSLATRRYEQRRRQRRRHLLIALAVVLAFFPPMWAVYFVAWLIWRGRPKQRSMRRVRKAVRALERNQMGIALNHLQEAHLLDPSNNDALYWLGLLLSRQHRQEEAEEALSLVAERVPGLPEVEAALVEAYVALDQPENAIYHAQRLFDAAPYAPESLLKLADAFEAAGRIDLAIEALEQAPLHKRTLTEGLLQIHYRLGALYERQGDPARALQHFKRVYSKDLTYLDVRTRVQTLEARLEP